MEENSNIPSAVELKIRQNKKNRKTQTVKDIRKNKNPGVKSINSC